MSQNKASKITPILLFIIIALIVGVLFLLFKVGVPDGKGGKSIFDLQTGRLKTIEVDADLASDTLNTIAIDSADIKDKFAGVEEANHAQNKQMREMSKVLEELSATNKALKSQLEAQNRKMGSMQESIESAPASTVDVGSIKDEIVSGIRDNFKNFLPPGMTVVDETEVSKSDNPFPDYEIKMKEKEPETTTRIRSYGVQVNDKGQIANPNFFKKTSNIGRGINAPSITDEVSEEEAVVVDPRFTIPTDAVLNDSVTITALIGRIPREGSVNDPAPFKVAIGRDNLAANGFDIPGLDGMIMSGTVYGDAVRRCVRTKITRATYIFEDGRILTLPKRSNRSKNEVIGYIASPVGDPCIAGRYYSNRRSQITKSILANMAAAGANAYAETQTTTLQNALGGTSSIVSGSDQKFITGSMVAQGASSVANQLLEDSFDQWDQVVVPVGQNVTIHIDVALEIDNASNLRKLVYENDTTNNGLTD